MNNIEEYLGVKFDKPGFFLEIGCWDGEHISNTVWLERERNWQGVCVDPFPRNFENRICKVAQEAISSDGLPREFIKVSIDRRHGGDVSYFSGFTDSIGEYRELIYEYCDYEEITIPTITLEQLWHEYNLPNYIDFLSIDTEGAELEILNSMDFTNYKFGVIIFEHNNNEFVRMKANFILIKRGYRLDDSSSIDDIYCRR